MKRLTFVAGLIASVACFCLQAGDWSVANIPFAFQAGEVRMPAGDYLVGDTSGVLTLRNVSARRSAVIAARRAGNAMSGDSKVLTFKKYGDEYFLAKVRSVNFPSEYVLKSTPREKELISRANQVESTDILAAITK